MNKDLQEFIVFLKTNRKIHALHFTYFFLILFLFAILNYFHSKSILEIENKSTAHQIENLINKELESFESDTRFLVDHMECIINRWGHDTLMLQSLIQNFSLNKFIYHQIRLIDTNGFEQIRFNHDTDQRKAYFETSLQNKNHRYYFQIGKMLDKEEIAYSKIDLNIENQQIEIPERPMLRIISPIYTAHKKTAILVMNANVKYIFRKIKEQFNTIGEYYLLNNNFYYLMHPQKELCFGFMNGLSGAKFTDEIKTDHSKDLVSGKTISKNQSQYLIESIEINNLDEIRFRNSPFKNDLLNNQYYLVYKIKNTHLFKMAILNKNMLQLFIISILGLIILYFERYHKFKKQLLKHQLIKKNNELATYNHTLKHLIDSASHDFRSPYSNIISLIELLEEHNHSSNATNTKEIQYLASRIKNISFRSIQMLDNLLTWSKLQINAIEIKNKRFLAKEIISPIIGYNELLFENKQIAYHYHDKHSLEVYSDKESLSIVIRNLVSNASKYSHEKGSVLIECYPGKNEIIFKIEDQGIGMTESQIGKLTDRNQSFSTQGTSGEKGAGIGMNLAFEFAHKLGGYISIESELGKGSVFKFHLPDQKRRP